jgi:hypothetical protein
MSDYFTPNPLKGALKTYLLLALLQGGRGGLQAICKSQHTKESL